MATFDGATSPPHPDDSDQSGAAAKDALVPAIGARIVGIVRRVYPDNLSIDLGNGLRGTLPRVQYSASGATPDPAVHFATGDTIDVIVVRTAPTKNGRIVVVVRYAELTTSPDKAKDVKPGDRFNGTVRKVFKDGVLVELPDGLQGHLRQSHISWFDKKPNPSRLFSRGDSIEVVVKTVDRKADGRVFIELSHREAQAFRPEDVPTRFPPGSACSGTVVEFLPFGAFIRIDNQFIGLLHNSEISWHDANATAIARFHLGESIPLVVERFNPQKRRLYVSFRQANERGVHDTFSVDTRTSGVVVKINGYALIVQITPQSYGILRLADMPQEAKGLYEVGDRVAVLVKHDSDDFFQLRLSLDLATLGEEWTRLTGEPPPDNAAQSAIRQTFFEGTKRAVTINYYERNPKARVICLAHYGHKCVICGFLFGERYGTVGDGFIHVHHVRPLSEAEEGYELDPIRDLRPVCPNCHAMVHRRVPAFTIEEIRALLKP